MRSVQPKPTADRPERSHPQASLLLGGDLPDPGLASLAQALPRAARRHQDRAICLIAEDGSESWMTYAQLLDEAARFLTGLREAGAVTGEHIVLHLGAERELLAAFWACILGGFIPVPVSAQLDGAAVQEVRQLLHQPRVLTDQDTGGQDPDPGARPRPAWRGVVDQLLRQHAAPVHKEAAHLSDTALLVLTAGSTGTPKAVALSHANIISRSHGTALANGLGRASVTFNWMPLDHVSGLIMFHVRDVLACATQIHARKAWVLADPLRWLDTVDRHRVDTTWAANSAFEQLTASLALAKDRSWDLRCLRYVMNGGAPVRPRTVRSVVTALSAHGMPDDAMRPGWGMSETSSGVVDHRMDLSSVDDSDRYVPVGKPHPGVEVRVVDDSDQVLPTGNLGHLQVRGTPVFSGYVNSPTLNKQSFTGDGWFRTGDMAVVHAGALTVTGSADDLITQGGRSCQGHEIEAEVGGLTFVQDGTAAACTLPGGELAVFCSLTQDTDAQESSERIRQLVRDRFGMDVTHVVPMDRDAIPRTPTGKPKRAALRASFAARRRTA